MVSGKLPPHDLNAEEGVLGSLLIDGKTMGLISLESIDFYHEPHGLIYGACSELATRHTAIDQITVAQELSRVEKLDQAGGVAFLSHLISVVPTSLDIGHYAEIVRRLSVKRKIIMAGQQIATIGHNGSADYIGDLEKADNIIIQIRREHGRADIVTPKERADLLMDRYHTLNLQDGSVLLTTGFVDLDRELGGGFIGGELIVLGGDTGLGKSTLSQVIAVTQSTYGNVLFCSGEMTVEGLSDREVASILGRDVVEIRSGKYDDDLYTRIVGEAIPEISERPLYYYRRAPLTCAGIRGAIVTMQARYGGVRCVVVDYLQKITTHSRESRYIQLGEITNELSDMAKELDISVLLLVQLLNKDIERRQDKRPHNGDIYESGRIEQDADVIMLLYRVDKYWDEAPWQKQFGVDDDAGVDSHGWLVTYANGEYPRGIAEVLITKQRQGGGTTKTVKIVWDEKKRIYQNLYRGDLRDKAMG